jgi:hypothetical protein
VAAPPDPTAPTRAPYDPGKLPISDPGDIERFAPAEASDITKEQRRFFRYDRNHDWRIT